MERFATGPMNWHSTALALSIMTLTACTNTPHRPVFEAGFPTHDCPADLEDQVSLHAEARAIEWPGPLPQEASVRSTGALGRQLLVSTVPRGLRPKDRITWSTLTIATYGGTLARWDQLQTTNHTSEPRKGDRSSTPSATAHNEIATVAFAPGQVKIARFARAKTDLSGTTSIDLLVMPGGVAVEDAVVHLPKLWQDNGKPLEPTALDPQFTPIRHPPGLDTVEASLELNFVIRVGSTGDEWNCSAESRVTLVDRDALRQPFWDLGLASANAGRQEWLALFDPALGAVRLVFDSPARAHAVANWIRLTRSMRLGSYELSIVRLSGREAGRPFGLVGADVISTLRPMTADDIKAIVVGSAGEP